MAMDDLYKQLFLKSGMLPNVVLVVYAVVIGFLKYFFFKGSGFLDTFVFILFLCTVYLATTLKVNRTLGAVVALFTLLVALPAIGLSNSFYIDISINIAIYAALALGLNIVVGFAGLLDLGYVAFFATGAYLWGIFGSKQANEFMGTIGSFPLDGNLFFVFAILAVFVTAGVGAMLGLPVLKLKGDYLAIVTLGLGEVVRVLVNNANKPINITNGPQGIGSIGRPLEFVAQALGGADRPLVAGWQAIIFYFMAIAVIGLVIFVTTRLDQSKIGRAWVAIREDEIAAQAMGVPLVQTKLIAFATGASFAGIMGVLFASKQSFISPDNFDINQSIYILAMAVFGGLGSIRGVIVGAAFLTLLNFQVLPVLAQVLNAWKTSGVVFLGFNFADLPSQVDPSKYQKLVFGLVLILMMLYRPKGLIPAKRDLQMPAGLDPDDLPPPPPSGSLKEAKA
jgi:branched-chain amino acid transport system permease protein